MRWVPNTLSKKLWITIAATILITVIFSYFLSNFFYQKLYVENVEESIISEGKALAADYEGGPLTKELRERVEWYNTISDTEIFIVNNPRELSACLPFDIDYKTLIGPEEREELLKGNTVIKTGFEERFDRKILGAIVPLIDKNGLEGIIYLYVPLAKISELTKDFSYLWQIAALLFLIVALFLGTLLVNRLTRPLKIIKNAAERISIGDYSVRVPIHSKDEIGQLADTFNHMSDSIQREDERKKEFLANVSHELRTPISYVKGYSEAMLTGIVKTTEDSTHYLSLIHREAGRMERLVGDLLDLAKLEADEYKLNKTPLSLAQLIEDAIQKYLPIAKEKGIDIACKLDYEIIIEADGDRIEQVLQNIIDNALRYTKEGSIRIILEPTNNHICTLKIKDTGPGIPEEDIAKLTQRFYRVNKARTRANGGTGLGLAIVDKIIKLHGGELTIESEVGEGTVVSFTLPTIN